MSRILKNSKKKIGVSPGSAVFVGSKKTENVRISVIDYDEAGCREKEFDRPEDCFSCKVSPSVSWINIDGLHETDIIETFGKEYGLHPLVVEDILNTHQRPKIEIFDDYIFVSIKMLSMDNQNRVASEQVSLIMGEKFVLSFQEKEGDVFDSLRKRIREGKGRIRKQGTDYLLYAILDVIVDNYFLILENFGDRVEAFDEELMREPRSSTLKEIYNMKREILYLRKSVWPLREAVSNLERSESELIEQKTVPFLRDLYDHTIQIIDAVETNRDLLSGMLDLYLSSVSNKMNEVMKVLTIIATIFIPLTFIAGIYGMNFEYMPELGWRYAYFVVWILMLLVGAAMLVFFRRKKWL
jgi:magnesium transporter